MINADVYNVSNSAWVYSQNNTIGTGYTVNATWLRPVSVLQSRMFKIGMQLDF